jgi:prevent-host-death family protein
MPPTCPADGYAYGTAGGDDPSAPGALGCGPERLDLYDIDTYNPGMGTVSIRDLSRNASTVVDEVARTGRPALVTRHGAPVVALVPIDERELEDLALARGDEYLADMAAADEDLVAGRTRSAADVFDELDDAATAP